MVKDKKIIPVYYWDSGVFSAYINQEADRWRIVQSMLEECNAGNIEIWTSTLSITEVASDKEGIGKVLSIDIEDRINSLWTPPSQIKLIEVSEKVCRQARGVIRHIHANNQRGIRSMDAIHIGSAIQKGIKEIHTFDDITKFADILGIKITAPKLIEPKFIYKEKNEEK
jgi:predicted nucleic acid-binding protein